MTNFHLFQIGDIPLHIHDQKLQDGYEIASRSEGVSFGSSPYLFFNNSGDLHEKREITINGYIASAEGFNADQTFHKLQYWVGRPTTVIGYVLDNAPQYGYGNPACICQCGEDCNDLVWVEATGVLQSVKPNITEPYSNNQIEITITLVNWFMPLDVLRWKWLGTPSDPFTAVDFDPVGQPQNINVADLPDAGRVFNNPNGLHNNNFVRYYYNDEHELILNPEYWENRINWNGNIPTDKEKDNGYYGTITLDSSNNGSETLVFDIDKYRWNAPPFVLFFVEGEYEEPATPGFFIRPILETNVEFEEGLGTYNYTMGFSYSNTVQELSNFLFNLPTFNDRPSIKSLVFGDFGYFNFNYPNLPELDGVSQDANRFINNIGVEVYSNNAKTETKYVNNYIPKMAYNRLYPGFFPSGKSRINFTLKTININTVQKDNSENGYDFFTDNQLIIKYFVIPRRY